MGYLEIVENGRKRMKELGIYDRYFTKGAETGATLRINREFFDTMRFRFNVIDAQPASTETEIFGCKLETPIMCAALSAGSEVQKITDSPLVTLAKGVKEAVVETGAPTVKIVKPYKDHKLVIQKLELNHTVNIHAAEKKNGLLHDDRYYFLDFSTMSLFFGLSTFIVTRSLGLKGTDCNVKNPYGVMWEDSGVVIAGSGIHQPNNLDLLMLTMGLNSYGRCLRRLGIWLNTLG
jgi:hypothetical protein